MQIHGGPGGRAQVIKLEKRLEEVGPCLSIALSEDPGSTNVWTIEVFVQYETLGASKLGEFTTTPPSAGDPPNRIVAFAGCPGAKGWFVQARTDDPTALADLNLDSSLYGTGLFGVIPNNPGPQPVNILTPVNTVNLGVVGSGRLIDVPLSAVPVTGIQVFVKSRLANYVWDATSTETPDNNVVVALLANGANPGRFIREDGGNQFWRDQATYHIGISPTAPPGTVASNDNDGSTEAFPLADGLEIGRRWGFGGEINVQTTIFVHGVGGTEVPMSWDVKVANAGAVYVVGDRTIVASGTINAFTAVVRTAGAAAKAITGTTAVNFATHVGQRMRITSVARLDARSVVDADNGGNSCNSTTWLIPPANRFTGSQTPTRTAPVANDTFDIYTVPIVVGGPLKVQSVQPATGGTTNATNGFILEDLDIGSAAPTRRVHIASFQDAKFTTSISVAFVRARIYGTKNGFYSTSGVQTNLQLMGTEFVTMGGNSASISLIDTSQLYADFDHYKNGSFSESSFACTIILGTVGDFSNSGMRLISGNSMQVETLFDGTNAVWGTTTSTNAWTVQSGATLVYANKANLTLKAVTNDALIGGTAKAYAAIPFIEPANNAGMVALA